MKCRICGLELSDKVLAIHEKTCKPVKKVEKKVENKEIKKEVKKAPTKKVK